MSLLLKAFHTRLVVHYDAAKIWIDMPLAVKYVGWAHGVLFVAYIAFGGLAALKDKWSIQFSAVAFIASLVPFGTFWLDKKLAKDS